MGTNDYTRANFGTLEQGATDFAQTHHAVVHTLDELSTDLHKHLAEWEGSAREAYWVAKGEWDKASAHMATVMQHLGGVIGTALNNYSEAERINSQLFG